jgi:hypothetical protein
VRTYEGGARLSADQVGSVRVPVAPPPSVFVSPTSAQAALLNLGRSAGNRAVTGLIQRQVAGAPLTASKAKPNLGNHQLDAPASLDEIQARARGPGPAFEYLEHLAKWGAPRKVPKPAGMSGVQAWAIDLKPDQARQLAKAGNVRLEHRGKKDVLAHPDIRSITAIYTNDGRSPFPNIGGGSDQELTAGVRVEVKFDNDAKGWKSGSYNFEIWTPLKGGAPEEHPGNPKGQYPSPAGRDSGGYKSPIFAELIYSITGAGSSELMLVTRAGANHLAMGEFGQNRLVHSTLGIPWFDWETKPAELYAALGLRGSTELWRWASNANLEEALFKFSLTGTAEAIAGTHESQMGAGLMLKVESAVFKIGSSTKVSVEINVGEDGRVEARYRDFGGSRAGLEGGGTIEGRIHLRDVRLGDLDIPVFDQLLEKVPDFDASIIIGGHSKQSTFAESQTVAGEDRPTLTGAWAGPGSKGQGWFGIEVPF